MIDPKQYEAIDPLALIFPTAVYVKIVEGKHPHVPKVEIVQKAIQGMTKTDKEAVLMRARTMMAAARIVEEAASKG
jgi:hypothetical protein